MALAARLALPLDVTVRLIIELFRIQFVLVFFRLLVFPVRLRGLSLKRRFVVTLGLYRIIPGILGLIAISVIFYFGVGMYKTRLIKAAFDESMARSFIVAEAILEKYFLSPQPGTSPGSRMNFENVRGWLKQEGSRPHIIMRKIPGSILPGDSTASSRRAVIAHTRGIPERFLATIPFVDAAADSAAGFSVADSLLWLVTSRSRTDAGGRRTAEIYVPMDSQYLKQLGAFTTAEIEITIEPTIFMDATSLHFRGDSTWTDQEFTLKSPAASSSVRTGFGDRRFYLARKFMPSGNWLGITDTIYTGAVMLTLYNTPKQFLHSLTETPYFVSSNAYAFLIFLVILFVFVIAELSAVRTGRSIAKGILDDVNTLTSAAKRIGGGDLEYRVPDTGKHELGILASSFNTMAADLKQHQQELLEKERMEADLAVAKEIQQRLLPQEQPTIPGLDVAGISIPSREVGGDLFYFLPLEQSRLGLAIGDVSGKSIPAALLMSNTLAAIRAETRLETKEEQILMSINRLLEDQIELGRFVTLFYGVADPGRGRFRYACAGHNPALKMSAAGKTEWLDESGMPLGVIPDSSYAPAEVDFKPGDTIVLYSDGVTEAQVASVSKTPLPESRSIKAKTDKRSQDGDDQEFFGEKRLVEAVRKRRTQSASAIIEGILLAVRDIAGGEVFSDDLTLVVLKHIGDGGQSKHQS
jgi:serine phosphatase RsbU (regulator of sigma subunit)